MCQSVISGSLTLRNRKIRGFGMKFYFSKIRMKPVMLSFLATTEKKIQNNRMIIAGKLSNIHSGKLLFAISIVENERRAVLSDIGDKTNTRAEQDSTEPE